jgi:hypothetical protein
MTTTAVIYFDKYHKHQSKIEDANRITKEIVI